MTHDPVDLIVHPGADKPGAVLIVIVKHRIIVVHDIGNSQLIENPLRIGREEGEDFFFDPDEIIPIDLNQNPKSPYIAKNYIKRTMFLSLIKTAQVSFIKKGGDFHLVRILF